MFSFPIGCFQTLNMLQVFCDNVGFRWVRLDGQTPTSQRQDIVNKFNSKHSQESKERQNQI